MFTVVVITEDSGFRDSVMRLVGRSRLFKLLGAPDHYPPPYELARLMSIDAIDLLLIDVGSWESASRIARQVSEDSSETVILGIGGAALQWQADLRWTCFDDLLPSPLSEQALAQAAMSIRNRRSQGNRDKLLAFLPSKAGSGCTLTVLHLAAALAQEYNQKVLLVESDLRSGVLSTLTKSEPRRYLQDALFHPGSLQPSEWEAVVILWNGVHIVAADRARRTEVPEWPDYYHFLRSVAGRYDRILVDLPEVVNPATAEVVRSARLVLVVTTGDLPALDLARQRSAELREHGVVSERIQVVLNRAQAGDLPPAEVESVVGLPVFASIPNDYPTLRRAVVNGDLAPRSSEVGKAYSAFAAKLLGVELRSHPSVLERAKLSLGGLLR